MYLSSVKSGSFQNTFSWTNLINNKHLTIPVLKFSQKGLPLFIGKIRPAELLVMSSVDQWNEDRLEGYQRERIKEKNREIKDFLKNCDIPIVPPIIASVKLSSFIPTSDDYGQMEIPIIPGNISLIDGQQRTGGFYELFYEIRSEGKKNKDHGDMILDRYAEFLKFEIPILLIDPQLIIKKLQEKNSLSDIKPIDVERAFFFVINKTQKSVSSSLKDELAYLTISAGITGIPAIEKDRWRVDLVPIVNELNKEGSPLYGLINLGGSSGLQRPIPLTSFVSSLKPLYDNPTFHAYSQEEKLQFLKAYWGAVKEVFPDAFAQTKQYLLTKTIGMYPMNSLSADILNEMLKDGKNPLLQSDVYPYILLLGDLDWSVNASEFRYFIGRKGTGRGYELLKEAFQKKI
ncbi:hypothetical protein McpAg1_15530 [Methanocorpusculaceae archaeon Ag1]|uniref:Uncharacterized protein n=2 Tax=Methanorbis furvi TaxID=3028299 RepID=A0AAE4MF22_9EURY|nr:hypothetical protein [Methanocorpusculaceae archaeon Ag1]